jgi:DNA-binding MarR family transcriptional regulator
MFPTYHTLLLKAQVYRAMNAYATDTLKAYNLTPPEWILMGILTEKGHAQPTEIAQYLGVKPPVVTSLLRRLETKKVISRNIQLKDSRFMTVTLTKKGKTVLKDAEKIMQKDLKLFLGNISTSTIKSYLKVLQDIAQKLNLKLKDM